jgi:AraC family transcriptional regulator of adaptative response/methylated-DNA-[protein]-cysteine methyltransferase
MPPARFRTGGAGELLHHGTAPSSLGLVLAAAGPRGVAAILIGTDPATLLADLRRRFPKAQLRPGEAAFETLLAQVIATVEAPGTNPALPLDIRGTAFQQRVWQALGAVPAGETVSYTELARRIGAPAAVRAVAGACAANAHAVAIPCHRVVRADGALSGYRWGIERKRALLEREREP